MNINDGLFNQNGDTSKIEYRNLKLPIPKKIDIKHENPVNHQLRDKADNTLEEMLKCVIGLALASPEELVKSCVSCDYFTEATEICSKANARPPARVIAFGCETYYCSSDDIPF